MQKHFFIWDNPRDAVIWITLMLLAIGCINVFSASFVEATDMFGDGYFYLKRYVIFSILGFMVMLGISKVDYHIWLQPHFLGFVYILVLALLVAVEFIGVTTKGAQRWLYIGPISLQPSELAKLAMIMVCAGELGRRMKKHIPATIYNYPGIRSISLAIPFAGLVYIQPDMGTAAIIMALPVFMYIIAGMSMLTFFGIAITAVMGVVVMIFDEPYRINRIVAWFDPWRDPTDTGYQIVQSIISIGSGGIHGLPWGQGTGKFFYLPESHTDFAFAIYCQEWGFIGALFLILLFIILGMVLIRVANVCHDEEGFMLVSGVSLLVVGQAFANMLMVCGVLPVIGVPLSFISYGGTSMVVSLTALGLVLSVYNNEVKREKREEMLREAGMPPIMPTSDLRRRGWRK